MKKVHGTLLVAAALVTSVLVSAPPVEAAFPGHNGKIAFDSARNGHYEIYVMNADGSGHTPLTDDGLADACGLCSGTPVWSPDGSRIAFAGSLGGTEEVYVMNADGSGRTNLTNDAGPDASPAWSPDGTQIAFASARDGNWEVYVMNVDGSGQTNLTNNPAHDNAPAWSPDGTRIAFTTRRDGNDEVYAMNVDGSGQANLSNNPAHDNTPAWSPDGTRIAFVASRDGGDEIYVMNADGSAQTNVTDHPGGNDWPAWSPDGASIAFTSRRDANYEVYVMNADGSGQTRLTDDPAFDLHPNWQPLGAADLAVTDIALATLDAADFSDLVVGQPFAFDAPVTVHNFGDAADDQPQSPVDAQLARTIEVPAGVAAFVEVTGDEAPATITVDDGDNPLVAINQSAGAIVDVDGPASITVGYDQAALASGSDRVVDTTFGVRCTEPGLHEIALRATIAADQADVVDAVPGNNTFDVGRQVECVMPVTINIRPGNPNNLVNPNSNQVIPVGTLTTQAGEYGSPLSFDAASIDHTTVRFGTLQTVAEGGGTTPSPNVPFVQDSFETDDSTKDGDLDMVLRFSASGSGIAAATSAACVVGRYVDGGGSLLTFFGCDTVQVQS